MNDFEIGEFSFSSNFDSGNLRKVELAKSCPDTETSEYAIHAEFHLWTAPDCYGTPHENANRTWFFFSIKGGKPFRNVKLNVKNLNRQAKLFSQGMQPVQRVGENGKWERIKDKPSYGTEADCFFISFFHRTGDTTNIPVYYAFTYPFTYTENLNLLNKFDEKFGRTIQTIEFIINRIVYLEKEERENTNKKTDAIKAIVTAKAIAKDPTEIDHHLDEMNFQLSPSESSGDPSSPSSCELLYEKMTKRELQNDIYYHRELLIHSLQGRRVELITISSYHGIQNEYEARLTNLFPDTDTSRCRIFKDKKIVFMSSRVHPGETAASFVLNGFLNLILDRKSSIGQSLRHMYVFKIVPFLNPDGVYNGLYRTDTLGQNLNRMYINPQIDRQPTIYAVKKLIQYYHLGYDKFDADAAIEQKDEMNSTASLFNFVEKLRSEASKLQSDSSNQRSSSKDTTSSEGEENNTTPTTTTIVQQPSRGQQSKGKSFTDKLIPELKTVAEEPLPKKPQLGSSSFAKKSSEHTGRKTIPYKTVYGSSHSSGGGSSSSATIIRTSAESKFKDIQHTTPSVQRPKFKKVIARKEVKGNSGNSSNISLKAINKRNLLCCQNIDISSEHLLKNDDGIVRPDKSNLFLYMDFHGHASKKGIFMYGNHFQSTPEAVECMLLPRLMGVNCQHFHCDACNFSERNMYRREKRDGLSKEGSGRVAVYKMTGLIKCYTLESNYNTGKYVNTLPTRAKDPNAKPLNVVPPKYAPNVYEEVGRAIGPSILDITNSNSLSRIYHSEFRSIQALRIAIRNELERHGSQRSGVNGGKIHSSQHTVKRVKRSSLSTTSTSNDVPKENKVIYHSNLSPWELAVPSSSTQTATVSILQSLNQPSKVSQRAARCIKRNPLKAHSTNLYGKKDSIANKKKPKAVLLLESSSSKKDHSFQIPPKKVRVSPTHNLIAKESSSPGKKVGVDVSTSPDTGFIKGVAEGQRSIELPNLSDIILPVIGDMDSKGVIVSDFATHTLSKSEKAVGGVALTNSPPLVHYFTAADISMIKKSTSESGLDLYTSKAETMTLPTSSNTMASYKSSGTIDEAVASCSSRIFVHSTNPKPILATFRKTKKVDNFLLKSVVTGGGGGASGNPLTSGLNSKMKSTLGTSDGSKLVKKKRIVRHDSLIVKRKKNKGKIARH